MKKILITLVIAAAVMVSGTASASLLGVLALHSWPDIEFDTGGSLTYDKSAGTVVIDAKDTMITYADGSYESLLSTLVTFDLSINVDANGNLVGTGTMDEIVAGDDDIEIAGTTYSTGDVLLTGEVTAFGWDRLQYGQVGYVGFFDFLVDIDPDASLLVKNGVWVDPYGTGISAVGEQVWDGSWAESFSLSPLKGDKFPLTPEPTSLLLLGSGLLGLAAFSRKKKRKV